MINKLEYIWLDGTEPTTQLRSKTKIITEFDKTVSGPSGCPVWGFDGSSTNQAPGNNSDCVLKPTKLYKNPIGNYNSYLVLCEVWNVDGTPHKTNIRYQLQEFLDNLDDDPEEWVGFEQEYTLYDDGKPLGWPKEGEPAPQGDYYCGRNAGEHIIKEHIDACIETGISICGTNSEVMLGQWEYQIGTGGSVEMSDDLWVARWLMEKICDKHKVSVSLDPKPVEGDWNGAGCHCNFSTKYMREDGGNERRLTGKHETQTINTFNWGVSDRGASIRIPWQVDKDGKGYLEDRRPSANCDPYKVSKRLVETIC